MQKIKLNTGVCPLLDVGMYNSIIAPSETYENDCNELEMNGYRDLVELFWNNFDFNKYVDTVVMPACEEVKSEMLDGLKNLGLGIESIKLIGIDSPRYYNYRSDQLDFDIEVGDDFQARLVHKLKSLDQEVFNAYLSYEFSSRSGFISFVANNTREFYEEIEADIESPEVGVAISYLFDRPDTHDDLNKSGNEDLQESFHEAIFQYNSMLDVVSDTSISDKLSEAFDQIFRGITNVRY